MMSSVWKHLPEELTEKIIAMLPFPSIFKARAISKSWLARLSSISSIDDDQNRRLAMSFQKQVREWSPNWETFCPFCFGNEISLAYHRPSRNWQKLPSLSFLLKNLGGLSSRTHLVHVRGGVAILQIEGIEGALLYGLIRSFLDCRGPSEMSYPFYSDQLFVTNILTQSWKSFSCAKISDVVYMKLVWDTSSQTYKMVVLLWDFKSLFTLPRLDRYFAHVYDSKSNAWSTTNKFRLPFIRTPGAYLNGVLYTVVQNNPRKLLAYIVESETLEELRLSVDVMTEIVSPEIEPVHLLVYNTSLLMLVTYRFCFQPLLVLKVDLESRQLVHLAKGPPDCLSVSKIYAQPISDDCSIFLGTDLNSPSRVVVYNVDEDEWSCLPVPTNYGSRAGVPHFRWASFQPGLNPFAEV